MILLGWEIGTGKRVEIPDTGHLAWFGQTQLSGKTTALEAIAFRGRLRAVAFITKQGEGGFLTGRMIPPYFSEPTNDEEQPLWRWVKSILEASQQRKMNFEESWIIRACEDPRQANTLAEVHSNIKSLISGEGGYVEKGRGKKKKREWKYSRKPVSGMNAGVYTSLKAYFDIVMPQLARLPYTKKLELGPGLNVMDLRGYAMETQALVIRSVMEWVYQHEKNVRVIVPEAQDFVPQGKNSPVKMACETLVRKAGANRNFMWLDSQDMAAVDKFALRACSIVGIGVQTEMHEIDRALATTFSPSLKPIDIARLKIGEFFVRTSEARVSKVYVQPAWMDSEVHAQAIAKGEESIAGARDMLTAFKKSYKQIDAPARGAKVEPSSPAALHEEQQERANPPKPKRGEGGPQLLQIQTPPGQGGEEGNEDETHTASPGESGDVGRSEGNNGNEPTATPVSGTSVRDREPQNEFYSASPESEDEEKMWKEKYEALAAEHRTLIEAHDALAKQVQELRATIAGKDASFNGSVEHGVSVPSNGQANGTREEIYQYVVRRATADPSVLALLVRHPELSVKIERATVQMDDSTITGKIARLIHDGYFAAPRNGPTVQKELKRRGCDQPTTNLYKPLNKLTEMGFLTLEPDGFLSVPEMKVRIEKA